ncbi:MAG: ornithine aminomutase subunit alpha [Bacillota bacterium]
MKERNDDYEQRRKHLESMSDQELRKYFFELSEKLVDPLVAMGHKYTSKSIERSVLLRMGFSSIEAKEIVDTLFDHHLLSKGAGHCVYRLAKDKGISYREAGEALTKTKHIPYLKEVFNIHEDTES